MIILFVGLTAGWVAGQMLQGVGFGIISDLLIGIVGAFIGSWLLPQFGIHLGLGIVAAIINATIGALVLLLIIRLVRVSLAYGPPVSHLFLTNIAVIAKRRLFIPLHPPMLPPLRGGLAHA